MEDFIASKLAGQSRSHLERFLFVLVWRLVRPAVRSWAWSQMSLLRPGRWKYMLLWHCLISLPSSYLLSPTGQEILLLHRISRQSMSLLFCSAGTSALRTWVRRLYPSYSKYTCQRPTVLVFWPSKDIEAVVDVPYISYATERPSFHHWNTSTDTLIPKCNLLKRCIPLWLHKVVVMCRLSHSTSALIVFAVLIYDAEDYDNVKIIAKHFKCRNDMS